MNRINVSKLLRFALRLDALASLATGVLLAALPATLAGVFGLAPALLLEAGVFCVAYAGMIGWMSARERLPAAGVWAVVLGNVGWAIGCVELAFGAAARPTALGVDFLVVQALAVLAFADLQYFGLRRGAATAAVAA